MSNSTLAARISALVDKWNGYKNALRDLLTKQTGTVDMEDGTGTIVTLPTFPALQASVNILTDSLNGAVSQAQSINAQTVIYMNAAGKSATDSDTARAASVVAKLDSQAAADASASSSASASAQVPLAAAQVTLAKAQVSLATDQVTLATSKATAAAGSATAAAGSASTAGTKADTATTQAGIATTQATAASNSATAANTSQTLALNYANAAVNVEVTPGNYSARHWAEQARLNVLGSLVFKGRFDASKGSLPASPNLGDFYLVSVGGTISAVKYGVGDMLFYDGTSWDRIDNQTVVQSVAGRTGNVVIDQSDVPGLTAALASKQGNLGFSPVQQGTGIGQTNSIVKIGWGSGKVKVTVDATDIGNFAVESWVSGSYAALGGATMTGDLSARNVTDAKTIANYTSQPFKVVSDAASAAAMCFLRNGSFGAYFGLDTDNQWKVGGWSYGAASYRVIHEGVTDWYCPSQMSAAAFLPKNSAGAFMSGNNSGVQMNGSWYQAGTYYELWANGGGWSRKPRVFVSSGDPGAAAGEGDLWIW